MSRLWKLFCLRLDPHDNQHNDTQHNDTQHDDTQYNDSKHYGLNCDTHYNISSVAMLAVAFFILMLSVIMMIAVMLNALADK